MIQHALRKSGIADTLVACGFPRAAGPPDPENAI